ncbi:hypothetical protein [Candidatus Lokiarchaeum ossiferum]|uniref:hypothetical protein n=1 Tax=Candidatus Lokiarchaeum ossiferum TaxID=2951803 RepID=UPI00352C0F17
MQTKMDNNAVEEFKAKFKQIYAGPNYVVEEMLENVQSDPQPLGNTSEMLIQKFMMEIIRKLVKFLQSNKIRHNFFKLTLMKADPIWTPVRKMVIVKRIEEFRQKKVVQKGKKYDISDLKSSMLGKEVIKRVGFGNRNILSKVEYALVTEQIKKLKYESPIVIKPTTTEIFFRK